MMENKLLNAFNSIFYAVRTDVEVEENPKRLFSKKQLKSHEEIMSSAMRIAIKNGVAEIYKAFDVYAYNEMKSDNPASMMGAPKPVTYTLLRDFCELVHVADRIIFFPNIPSNKLYVEPYNNKEDIYSFVLHEDKYYTLRVKLDQVPEPVKIQGREYMNTISVECVRHYCNDETRTDVFVDEIAAHGSDEDSIFAMYATQISDMIFDECFSIVKKIINSMTSKHGIEIPSGEAESK